MFLSHLFKQYVDTRVRSHTPTPFVCSPLYHPRRFGTPPASSSSVSDPGDSLTRVTPRPGRSTRNSRNSRSLWLDHLLRKPPYGRYGVLGPFPLTTQSQPTHPPDSTNGRRRSMVRGNTYMKEISSLSTTADESTTHR